MEFSLDRALEIISKGMPKLVPNLNSHKDKIKETLDVLSLQRGEEYLSVGIGKNILPLIVAMHGVYVTGVDIDKESLIYQEKVAKTFAPYLRAVNSSLAVYNFNVDDPMSTQSVNGFKVPEKELFKDRFDIVDFLNVTSQIGDDDKNLDLADILLGYGKPESRYLISTFGGLIGKDDLTIRALISEIKGEREWEIVKTKLFVSNNYVHQEGVLLKVYRLSMR